MDEIQLQQLKAALAASPDNTALLMVILHAHWVRNEIAQARDLLRNYDTSIFTTDEQRRLAAEILLAAGEANQALQLLDDETPETLLLQAKALLTLERHAEGLKAYQASISRNPALEDPVLRRSLGANITEIHRGDDRPRLKVISNDDTDATEVARILLPDEERVSFADVGGLEHVKKTIHKKIILPYQKPSLFQRFRKRVGGGILMYGPPGCGKTLLARATAGECEAAFFNVAISDILDMYIGESERKLHAIFETAREQAPAVLFFDEVEAIGGKRQYTREGTSSKLVSQFLAEMDGFAQDNQGVLILAATNVPWAVDSAFRRPGRFDRVLFVPPPDREARASILERLLSHRPVEGKIDLDFLAKQTSGFSGADLRELVETAVDEAIDASLKAGGEVHISQAHLRQALQEVKPTTKEWLTTARNYARYANEGGQYDEVLDFLQRHGKN